MLCDATGKTLQAIALLYSLLKGGPYGAPVVRKGVVVCPSTLLGNWLREFSKFVLHSWYTLQAVRSVSLTIFPLFSAGGWVVRS